MRDRATGRARGFGFVVFADPTDAERVIMEKHVIDGRMVEAKKAVPRDDQHILSRNFSNIHGSPGPGRTKKIFVGGLASTVTENEFKKYFEQYEEAVDRVLHKTFHELNGKMVEVKRAVPKELSPGPSRSPLMGGYNMNSVGGFGMRMDGRFNPLAIGRSGFAPFGTSGYGMSMNLEPVLSPSYDGGSNFGNTPAYGRISSPYYSSHPSRYNTPIGYGVGNARNNSLLSPTRNVWGNGVLNTATNPGSPGPFLKVEGVRLVILVAAWVMGVVTTIIVWVGQDLQETMELVYHHLHHSLVQLVVMRGESYGEFYRSGSVYGDSTWRTAIPELDGSGSFGYGPEDVASDVTTKSSEGCIGSYGVTSRQTNRGNTLL
ncbi:hypothetical protein OIU84_002729 [Salix udensis]|uniref:RRM domain-containing protein n=1 Tax=Salix udensis TaxID=889485 RepID=A0AAD6K4W9_9ROSI|nr:hypothetical protein OIU84_002729 [Salix udensis]